MKPRILNVDDSPAGLYAKTRVLERAGFEVFQAESGEDALRLVREAAPSLVLLDVQLPDINGIEVCRRIKSAPATQHLPVLHISATYTAEDVRLVSAESGADVYLVEPVEPEELITVVRTLLRLRTTQIGLAESEARLRLAIEQAEIATWDIDLRTGAAVMSARLYEVLGYRPMDGAARVGLWFDRIHPDDRERVEATLAESRRARTLFACEHRIRRADNGEERWLAPLGNVQADEHGEFTRLIGVVMDVTARKRLEARREELLEREYAARTEAERAARLMDQFLATLSHELRTPMSAVLGWLQLLRTGRLSTDQTRHALDTIERNARLQNQLINDMLDVSRIVTDQLRLDLQPLSASAVVEAVLASMRPLADARQVELDAELPPPTVQIHGDPSRLEQVFANVLGNAVKFSQPGDTVTLRSRVAEGMLQVEIRDTGAGIAAEALPYIFELFRQADGSFTRSHGGLGLGLAIVRHLVDLHGGTVRAESAGPGTGATFTIQLPLAVPVGPALESAPPETPREAHSLRGVHVLVVDDDAGALELARRILVLEGAEVTTASSAEEALAVYARDARIEVILSDIGMPHVDGNDFLRRVRSEFPQRRRPAAIALSGYARSEDRETALAAGFDLHVAKPFDVPALCVAIAMLTARRNGEAAS